MAVVVVAAVVAVVVVMMPQAAVSRCSMQWPARQAELPARQAEVDRLHAAADAAGHEYLVARYPDELHAITHGMDLPMPFRLQVFDYNAERQYKQVRKSTSCARTRTHTRTTHASECAAAINPLLHMLGRAAGTEGVQQKHQGRS